MQKCTTASSSYNLTYWLVDKELQRCSAIKERGILSISGNTSMSGQPVDLPDLYALHWNRLALTSVKKRHKKRIAPVSLNGCQPGVSDTWPWTKQLSPCWRERTHRYRGRIFWYVWMLLLKVLLKCPINHPLHLWRRMLRHCEGSREGTQQSWHCLSVVVTSTRPALASSQGNPDFVFFLSTTCHHVCCVDSALHFLESPVNQTPRGGLQHELSLTFSNLCAQWLSLLVLLTQCLSCLFRTNRTEENINPEKKT